MAEAGECKENPFSFKNFVKSKQETTSPKTKKAQRKQNSKESTGNLRNQNHFKDEAPFPEVNKGGTKLTQLQIFQSVHYTESSKGLRPNM